MHRLSKVELCSSTGIIDLIDTCTQSLNTCFQTEFSGGSTSGAYRGAYQVCSGVSLRHYCILYASQSTAADQKLGLSFVVVMQTTGYFMG